MSDIVVTARIDAETAARLERIGAFYDRKRAWLIAQAVKRYAEDGAAYVDFIQEGIDSANRGEFVSHEDVVAEFVVGRPEHRSAA